jgi:hypothetical protein
MIPITNQQQLILIINELLEEILEQIARETVEYLRIYVDTLWYQDHWPDLYKRTYQLLDSITHSNIQRNGNKFDISIYFDSSKIIPRWIEGNAWNEHMGFDGSEFTMGLVQTIEEGNPSPFSPDYAEEGIGMFEATDKWLDKELPKIAKRIFKENGIDVVIT